ncbi:MAG: peptide-methionine (S)-S-oxide reductase MsrA [Actinomycetota bacterium]
MNDFKQAEKKQIAYFGGGCFWCLEASFRNVKGVADVVSGYAGGHTRNPAYVEICQGHTGHAEVVQIAYNPAIIPFEALLHIFFSIHNPTTINRQGNDIGSQYRSIVLFNSEQQQIIVKKVVQELTKEKMFSDPIVTEVVPLSKFYRAEDYHQRYFEKNAGRVYCQLVVRPKIESFQHQFSEYFQ